MEATGLPSLSLSVRCGVLGTNFISLVTVIWERFVDAQGTKLAVLHPELGTQRWGPTSQARWETSNSISLTLTLEQSKAKTSLANTTFCCEFVTFPHGSRVACGELHSSDPGVSGEKRGTARILTLAAHLTPLFVPRTLCPNFSPRSSSKPGQDLGDLRASPAGFRLHTLSPVAAEALVRMGPVTSSHHLARRLLPLTPPLLSPRCFSKSQPSPISTRAQTQAQVRLEGWCLEQGTRGPPQPASKASLATPPPPPFSTWMRLRSTLTSSCPSSHHSPPHQPTPVPVSSASPITLWTRQLRLY